MNMNKKQIRWIILNIIITLLLVSCRSDPVPQDGLGGGESIVGMGNPSAVYCQDLGYEFGTINEETGERGICIFSEDQQCDAWQFLGGTCGEQYSYCAQQGYNSALEDDPPGSARSSVMCVDDNYQAIGPALELMELHEKSLGNNVSLDESEPLKQSPQLFPAVLDFSPPTSFDWRNNNGNWLTLVRNQASCGSCWAFAAVGVAEAAIKISRGNPAINPDLSEQYLVTDCQPAPYGGNYQNCCGGYTRQALYYIRDQGIPDESCLPYIDGTSYDGSKCTGSANPRVCGSGCANNNSVECSDRTCTDRCSDWSDRLETIAEVSLKVFDPDPIIKQTMIKQYLIEYGPLAASMRVESTLYSWGDFSVPYTCQSTGTNHGVVIVGYQDVGDSGYWIIRNSWGSGFGDGGYFRIGYRECQIESSVYAAYNNDPPNEPTDPSPADLADGVSTLTDLVWSGGDPNPADTVTYDVYLEAGDTTPDVLVCDDANSKTCDPGELLPFTQYYFQVVSSDDYGHTTSGPIWSFTSGVNPAHNPGLYLQDQGKWYLKTSHVDGWGDVSSLKFNCSLDCIPVTGDWNNDGLMTPGFYNSASGKWYLKNNFVNGWNDYVSVKFAGPAGSVPVTGDWNGDGTDTIGFYNPVKGKWYLKDDQVNGWNNYFILKFAGSAGYAPLTGDWNGDGTDTVGFYVQDKGSWYLKDDHQEGWTSYTRVNFGGLADPVPVTGNWDGDGGDTIGFYLPADKEWYLKDSLYSGWGEVELIVFGGSEDWKTVPGNWQ